MSQDLAAELEGITGHIGDVPRADIQVTLRRAALIIRNSSPIGLDVDCEDAVCAISGELNTTRSDMIRWIVMESLETNGYLPVRFLDEDDAIEGSA